VGLPRTKKYNDLIRVIVNRLMKFANFFPVKTTYIVDMLGRICIQQIVRLCGIPMSVVSDRGSTFTSRFWKTMQKALGTQLDFRVPITYKRMVKRGE